MINLERISKLAMATLAGITSIVVPPQNAKINSNKQLSTYFHTEKTEQ